MDKEDAILLSEFGKTLWAIRQRAIASGELVPKTHDELLRELDPEAYIVKLHEALAASELRNRELTRQVEQLQAERNALRGLVRQLAPWLHSGLDRPPQTPEASFILRTLDTTIRLWDADDALTAPPSSAPSDDRADTGRSGT